MDKKKLASEIVKLAKELIAFRLDWKKVDHDDMDSRAQWVITSSVDEIYEVHPEGTNVVAYKYFSDGTVYGVAFSGRARKPIFHYRYGKNENRLDDAVEKLAESSRASLESKKKRREERKQFKHDYQIGDILYSSWGYDQTNIDFYEVVGLTAKTVTLQEIGSKVVKDHGHTIELMPVPGRPKGKILKNKRVSTGKSVKINSFASAYKWDGKPKSATGYGYGH